MKLLKDKIVLVTGGSRGLGKAITVELAEQGAFVYATATTQKGADAISTYLQENQLVGKGLVLNLSAKDSIDSLLATLKADNAYPDVLVNNAGITRDNLLLRMKDEEWNDVITTNLNSVFYLSKALVKPMLKKRWGRIINISSITALMGNPGQCNYAAAKAGVIGFSKSLALEVASRNITVNVVAPGFIETDMTKALPEEQREQIDKAIPMGKMGVPEDIAATVNFLASPAAGYITGETIQVSGGLYIR